MDRATAGHIVRPRVEIGLLVALFAILFAPFMMSTVAAWNTRPDASHGWFVLPIAGWIAWKKKEAFLAAPAGSFKPAIGIIVLGLLAAVLATRTALESVGRVSLVLTLNGLLLYLLGIERYRTIAFPALFLFLMVPVPITITGSLTFPLQLVASRASELSISLIGIPVSRMGNVLQLPGGRLEVAEACSGLRSLMSFVTVGALLAWVSSGAIRRVGIVVLAIPFALFANVLRITLTAAAVHLFGPGGADGLAHDVIGVGSFLIGIGLYAAVARLLGSRWAA